MQKDMDIDELTKRLIPLTVFRRQAGKVLKQLSEVESFILTKDGKPFAKLSILEPRKSEDTQDKLTKLKKLAGGFHLGKGLSPSQLNKLFEDRYE